MKENIPLEKQYFRHLTPRGKGGISTFLLHSENISEFTTKHFKSFNDKKTTLEKDRFCYGKLIDQNNELIDEIILNSIDNKQVEIHSHGGNISHRSIIKFLESVDFYQMPESVYKNQDKHYHYHHALKNTITVNEFEFLKSQISNFNRYKNKNLHLTSEEIINHLKNMILVWQKEKSNRRRASICLSGVPNSGKSSLINAITGKKRSLVSNQAKTTRDTVTENFQTRGYRVKIIDTAGLHQPDNLLDKESVTQAIFHMSHAEIVLWLHDCTLPFFEEEQQYLMNIQKQNKTQPIWLILSKVDLKKNHPLPNLNAYIQKICSISSQSGEGVENLLGDLIDFLFPQNKATLEWGAISEQMAIEIHEFLQKVDLKPANHKMLQDFFLKIIHCIPD